MRNRRDIPPRRPGRDAILLPNGDEMRGIERIDG